MPRAWDLFSLAGRILKMKRVKRTLSIASISVLGLLAGSSSAQLSKSAPEKKDAPVKEVQPAQTGHEGHNHGANGHEGHNHGVQPTEVHNIPVNQNGEPQADGPLVASALLFKETTVSTGTILDIEPVPVEFEFKNTGTQPLEIQLVKPSCGCTVPEMEQKSYAPGETGTMKVTFDPSGKKGAISRVITIYTNSASKPVHTVYVHSFVKNAVIIEPRVLAFDLTQKGSSATKDIKVFGRSEDFKVTRATTQDPDTFAVEVVNGGKVEKDGEELWLQILRVKILESAKPDNHRTELSVRTNDEHKPIFSIAAVGRVIGDLEMTPVRMTMGRLVVGDEFEREITIKSKAGNAFEIKSVTSNNVVLDAQYTAEPVDPEKRTEWTIRAKGTVINPAQRFNAQLTVMTDVPDEEMLTVQMYGQLQPKLP
jgi:Protein of unknown function (DUF1573)